MLIKAKDIRVGDVLLWDSKWPEIVVSSVVSVMSVVLIMTKPGFPVSIGAQERVWVLDRAGGVG